jgi:mannose-6-phosphate isomerase-like protein (cupin superfamily)
VTEEHGAFDVRTFADELERAPGNHDIGTSLLFENDRVRVFRLRLEPGERAPFHIHDAEYFWTVVEPGRGLQRLADGTSVVRDYRIGETRFLEPSPENPLIHDQENVGDTPLAFVTVELTR